MPDIPRDPRQLARDILSGKVRIEDLARERQMRQGGAQVPAKIPLPRPMPPAPPPPRPMQRTPQQLQRPIPQQRPGPLPQQRQIPRYIPGRAPAPRQQPGRPVLTVPPPVQRAPQSEPLRKTEPPAAPAEAATKPPAKRALRISALVRSRLALRQGILLAEVLGKPLALRDEQ